VKRTLLGLVVEDLELIGVAEQSDQRVEVAVIVVDEEKDVPAPRNLRTPSVGSSPPPFSGPVGLGG
jgi:hypothetical protein